jgi:hypothetical protein
MTAAAEARILLEQFAEAYATGSTGIDKSFKLAVVALQLVETCVGLSGEGSASEKIHQLINDVGPHVVNGTIE